MKKEKLKETINSDDSIEQLNEREFGAPMSQEEKKQIHILSENNVGVSEIGRILKRPNTTIYEWKKKLNI